MKNQFRRVSMLFALLLATPLALSAQSTTTDEAQLPAQMREARAAVNSAYAGLRAEEALSHYAEDVRVVFNGQEFRGKSSARAWLQDALAGLAALRFGSPTFTLRENEVFETSPYTITIAGGEQANGMVETLWRLQDGAWRVSSMSVTVQQ